jgi:hypothetical protein
MVVERIPSALWATLAFVVAIDIAGCEGKSTSNGRGDGDAGEGENGGASQTGGKGGTG